MDVGVESKSAVLYVKGESVNIKVTRADNFDWLSIVHDPGAIQIHIWYVRGSVLLYAARQEKAEE